MRWEERAHAQTGVIRFEQLTDCGLSQKQVRGLVARGELAEVHPHVYLHSSVPASARQGAWAAVLWSGGVLSHRSAAALWGIEAPAASVAHVTVGDLRFRRRAVGVRVHRVEVAARDIGEVGGLPVTSRARTIIDLLRTEPRRSTISLFDRALQLNLITAADLRRAVADQPGRAGNVRLRELLARLEPGAQAESERLLHRLLRGAAITGWRPQLRVRLAGQTVHVDVGFREQRVGIEVDGRKYHDVDSDRFEHDRMRQNLLVASGWIILRVTWRRLNDEPEAVVAEIRSALKCRD